MQFYKLTGIITNEKWEEENSDRRVLKERIRKISMESSTFNQGSRGTMYAFVSDASESAVSLGFIVKYCDDFEQYVGSYLSAIQMELKDISVEEITLANLCHMLRFASHNDYVEDADAVLYDFELTGITGRYSDIDYDENLLDGYGKKTAYRNAEKFLVKDTLLPELDRIYAGSARQSVTGHPVHYVVSTDDVESRREICRTLLNALYDNDRIVNRRYCFTDIYAGQRFSRAEYDCLYKSNIGGAILVRYKPNDNRSEDNFASADRITVETLCEVMKKYCNLVLTVFCLPRECTLAKSMFYENLSNVGIVEINEEFVSGDRAKDFLKMLARENGVRTDKKLFAMLEDDKGYLAPDLSGLFDRWYNEKLKTCIYPQYKDIAAADSKVVKAAPKGSAYSQLQEMIGLTNAKKVIQKALDYFKAQKLFTEKGLKNDRPAMHMVFTGNPGTAKTTVARLFAQIMRDNGLLSKGHIVEVGRGDLVGKYVGWTAPTVQRKFKDAQGGVLFIDEAYSLVDDRDGMYGDEAISTIVQEMENHRDDVVVIFAGYPGKMETFLNKNPGLRSRIAFHVPFDDYTAAELTEIAKYVAKQKGRVLSDDACDKLNEIFDSVRRDKHFGNGRYVRNVIESAEMAHASRLIAMDLDSVKTKDLMTITAADVEMPESGNANVRCLIGFGS